MPASRDHARESMISSKSREITAIFIFGFAVFALISIATYVDSTAPAAAACAGHILFDEGNPAASFVD